MATQVIDRLVSIFDFSMDPTGARRIQGSLDQISNKTNSVADTLGKLGAALSFGKQFALFKFAGVESAFARIEGLVGISRDQLNAWLPELERISAETGKPLEELAEGLFFVTSAGLRGQKAIDALSTSARASVAGLGDVQTIADTLTSAIGAYGEANIESAKAGDQMTAAIREGKLEADSLGSAIVDVLPVAAEMGVSFGQVAGIMAALSRQGFNASKGATGLRGILSKLIKPSEQGKKELEAVGLSMEGIRQAIEDEGLLAALGTVRTAFRGNNEALGRVFEDVEALNSVLALTNQTFFDNVDIVDRVVGANKDLDKAIKPVLNTLQFRWDQVMTRGMNVVIGLGEALAPAEHKFLDMVTAVLDWYDSLGDGPTEFIATILSLGPTLVGAFFGLRAFTSLLGTVVPLLAPIGGIIAVIVGGLGAIFLPLITAVGGLVVGLFGVIGPIGSVIALVTALGTAVAATVLNWDTVTVAIKNAFEAFQEWLSVVVDDPFGWLTRSYETAKNMLSDGLDGFLDWVSAVVDDPFGWLLNAYQHVLDFFSNGVQKLMSLLSGGTNEAIEATSESADGLFGYLSQALDGVISYLSQALDGAISYLSQALNGLIGYLSEPFAWIKAQWHSVIALLETPVNNFLSWIGIEAPDAFGWIARQFQEVTGNLWDLLPTNLRELFDGVYPFGFVWGKLQTQWVDLFNSLWGLLPANIRELFDGRYSFAKIWGGIKAEWTALFDSLWNLLPANIRELFNGGLNIPSNPFLKLRQMLLDALDAQLLEDTLKPILDKVVELLLQAVRGQLSQGLIDLFMSVLDGLLSLVPDSIKSFLGIGDASEAGRSILSTVGQGIEDGAGSLKEMTKGVLASVRDLLPFSDAREGPLSDLTASGRALMQTLAEGVRQGASSLDSALLDNLRLPVAPSPASMQMLAAASPGAAGGRSITLNVDRIEILAQGGDPQQMAGRIYGALEDELRRAVEVADSQVVL